MATSERRVAIGSYSGMNTYYTLFAFLSIYLTQARHNAVWTQRSSSCGKFMTFTDNLSIGTPSLSFRSIGNKRQSFQCGNGYQMPTSALKEVPHPTNNASSTECCLTPPLGFPLQPSYPSLVVPHHCNGTFSTEQS